jgi:hypothetical protein
MKAFAIALLVLPALAHAGDAKSILKRRAGAAPSGK